MGKNIETKPLTARARRDLEIEIGFLERLIDRDPCYIDALKLLGEDYLQRGDLPLEVRIAEQLCLLSPGDPSVHYNLACSHSLTGYLDLAVESLERALELGFHDFRALARDPDLKNLRRHPRFMTLEARFNSVRITVR